MTYFFKLMACVLALAVAISMAPVQGQETTSSSTPAVVPDVVGLPYEEASQVLRDAGFRRVLREFWPVPTLDESLDETVATQSPAAGTEGVSFSSARLAVYGFRALATPSVAPGPRPATSIQVDWNVPYAHVGGLRASIYLGDSTQRLRSFGAGADENGNARSSTGGLIPNTVYRVQWGYESTSENAFYVRTADIAQAPDPTDAALRAKIDALEARVAALEATVEALTSPQVEPPSSPTGLIADLDRGSVTLTWDQHPGEIDGVVVHRRPINGDWAELTRLAADATSYIDPSTSAAVSRKWVYRLTAVSGDAASRPTPPVGIQHPNG